MFTLFYSAMAIAKYNWRPERASITHIKLVLFPVRLTNRLRTIKVDK